jgi:phosphatidyl-myo-inositol dimannoside synthase
MKVLVTLDFPPEAGGIQRYLHGIVSHMFTKEDMVLVGCGASRAHATAGSGVAVEYLSTPLSRINKKWSMIPLAWRLLRLRLGKGKAPEVECGNVYAALVPWILCRFARIRYRVYVYGSEVAYLDKNGFKNHILRSALSGADSLIAISGFSASLVARLGMHKPVTILPPKISINTPEHTDGEIAPAPQPVDTIRILSVGRLVPHKGHRVLLEAVSQLPANLPWRCVVVGDGPQREPLRAFAAQKGIAGRVEFAGAPPDGEVAKEYAKAAMFVLPSTSQGGAEGFGIVLLEAMAARLPIIASDTGGVPEVLDKGACGILVPENDAVALAAAITRLAGDPALGRELATRAWERLTRHYVW